MCGSIGAGPLARRRLCRKSGGLLGTGGAYGGVGKRGVHRPLRYRLQGLSGRAEITHQALHASSGHAQVLGDKRAKLSQSGGTRRRIQRQETQRGGQGLAHQLRGDAHQIPDGACYQGAGLAERGRDGCIIEIDIFRRFE